MAPWGRKPKPNPTKEQLAHREAERQRYRDSSPAERKRSWVSGRDEQRVKADDAQRKANPSPSEKVKKAARAAVNSSGAGGKCKICNRPGQAHHTDYEKPLQVTYLCSTHHAQAHSGTRA